MPRLTLLLTLITAVALAAPATAGALDLERVDGEYDQPVHVTGPPGDASRVLVVEREGRIQLVKDGRKMTAPYLDIAAKVDDSGGEEGLLSIAFASADAFYVFYTAPLPDTTRGSNLVVERYAVDPGGDSANRDSGVEILSIPHTRGENHNGGQLHIGPDGHLWISTGDGGGVSGDSDRDAQNPQNLLGKILRIAPQPEGGYVSPPGNPYDNAVWATGLRNPWRFSFDRATGDLLIGDVGEGTQEEIDHAPGPERAPGANFGWPYYEGTHELQSGPPPATHHEPLITHTQDEGWQAITGGYVIRSPGSPDDGKYVYGDFFVDRLWLYDFATRTKAPSDVTVDLLASFGEDGVGRLYATSYGGSVHRLVPAPAPSGPPQQPPPGPGPGPGAGPTLPGPALSPVDAATLRRQRALRKRRVFARVGCEAGCRATLKGRLKVGRRTFRLVRGSRTLPADDEQRRIVAKIGRRARRAARRALRRGRDVEIALTLVVVNGDGRTVRRRFSVDVVG